MCVHICVKIHQPWVCLYINCKEKHTDSLSITRRSGLCPGQVRKKASQPPWCSRPGALRMVPSSSSPCAEPTGFALRFQFLFFVFALNAESSCLLSKLLCLLSSFLLNIVSVGAMEIHFFIVMTLGALVSKGGVGVEGSRGGQTSVSPKIGSIQTADTQRGPRGGGRQGGCF